MLKGNPSHLDCVACVGSCIHFCCHTQCLYVLHRRWRYLQEASKPQGIVAVGNSIVCQRIWGLSLLSPLEWNDKKCISSVIYSQYGTYIPISVVSFWFKARRGDMDVQTLQNAIRITENVHTLHLPAIQEHGPVMDQVLMQSAWAETTH